MLRTQVAESLRREFEDDGYLLPDYEGYCFANVPHTVASVLGAETGRTLPEDVLAGVDTGGVETVLVVLVDGFGFQQWQRERDCHAFLDRLTDTARVTPLTSTYPSETAAATNTFHSGALPAQHGVVGWNVYEPREDVAFEALPFETKDGEEPPIDFADVADADALYPALAESGVDSHHVVPFETSTEGTTTHTYETLDGFSKQIRAALDASRSEDDGANQASYCFAYLPTVDAEAHESGTESADYRETVGEAFAAIEDGLAGLDDATAEETLVVVTADHGHVNTDPERNVNLDRMDWLVDALARHDDGTPIRFAGSPRNVHLHLREGVDEEAIAARLRDELDALSFTAEAALDRELFGDAEPSATFRRRLGDVVLTHRNLGTWFGDAEPDELGLVGMHGGLSPAEMLVPFAVVRADELVE